MIKMESTMKQLNFYNHCLLKAKNGLMKTLQEKFQRLLQPFASGFSQYLNIMKNHKL